MCLKLDVGLKLCVVLNVWGFLNSGVLNVRLS